MAASVTFLQEANNNTAQTTYTFASQNLGTASSDRYIVVVFAVRTTSTTPLTVTATIQGISATSVVTTVNQFANTNRIAIFIAAVPTGTTGDVVLTCSRSCLRSLISVYSVNGINSETAFATTTSTDHPTTGTITIPADGICIAGAMTANAVTGYAWTNLTERSDTGINSTTYLTTASDAFSTSQTSRVITATNGGTTLEPVGIFASWSPSAGSAASKNNLQLCTF